jgi:DNA-binding transcriptional ArsR family regulator
MPEFRDALFRSLADPTRRAIFERLCREGEQTVGALTAQAGISQPAVSKHLGILKLAGLVRDRHEGRQTHYSVQLDALAPLIDWTSEMTRFWQGRLDNLEDLLKRMDQLTRKRPNYAPSPSKGNFPIRPKRSGGRSRNRT